MEKEGYYFLIKKDSKGVSRFFYNPKKNSVSFFKVFKSLTQASKTKVRSAGRGPASLAPLPLSTPSFSSNKNSNEFMTQFLEMNFQDNQNQISSNDKQCAYLKKVNEFFITNPPIKKLECHANKTPKSILIRNYSGNPIEVRFNYVQNTKKVSQLRFKEVKASGSQGIISINPAINLTSEFIWNTEPKNITGI